MRIAVVWVLGAILYGLFVYWYTNWSGPLTNAEVSQYLQQLEASGASSDNRKRLEDFMKRDDGREFFMVNLLQPGQQQADQEAVDNYISYMLPKLLLRASLPLVVANALGPVVDRVGLEDDRGSLVVPPERNVDIWESAALFRYRSRRDMMDIVTLDDFRDVHSDAAEGWTKKLAFPTRIPVNPADPRLLLGLLLMVLCSLYTMISGARRRRSIATSSDEAVPTE